MDTQSNAVLLHRIETLERRLRQLFAGFAVISAALIFAFMAQRAKAAATIYSTDSLVQYNDSQKRVLCYQGGAPTMISCVKY